MQGRLGISKDTPVRVQVRTERVSCKWKAEDRYRCRRGRNDFSLCVGGHGRKLERQGGTRNMRAWARGCHGPGKCCQVASDFFRLAVALSVSNSPDQWLDWDTRRKLLQRRGCSFFMLQQAIVSLRDALESRLHSGVVLPRFSLCNQQLHLLVWASDWWLRLPPGVGVERGRLQRFWQTRAQKKTTQEERRSTIVQVTWLHFRVKGFDFNCWINQAGQAIEPKLLVFWLLSVWSCMECDTFKSKEHILRCCNKPNSSLSSLGRWKSLFLLFTSSLKCFPEPTGC